MRAALLIFYRAFSDLAGKGSLLAITVFAAHRLSPREFGVFALASTLGWILAVASDFGIQLHLARSIARRPQEAANLLGTWLRVRLWTAGGAIVAVAVGLIVVHPTGNAATAIGVFALVYVVSGLIEFLHYFYRGLGRTDVESSLTLWQRSATLGCALFALAWRADVTLLGAAMLVPVLVTFGASLRIATRLGRTAAGAARRAASPPIRLLPEFQRDVLPIGAAIVLSALYFRVDLFLLQLWSGTEPVALYNAVFRLVEALRLFPAAVLAVALPLLCRADSARPLARVALAVTAFAVAATIVLSATAAWAIPLVYGAHFAAAVPAFRILILAFPLMSLNFALTHQLIAWDGQRAYAALCGLALVVNVALNGRLIPALSIEGAAWATLWTEVFLTTGCVVALWMGGVRRAPSGVPAGVAS